MRVPEERRSVPAAFLASFTTNFSDSKCQMAVAVLHRCQNTSIHRRDAEYERERVQRAPHTPIAVRPRFSMIEFTPPWTKYAEHATQRRLLDICPTVPSISPPVIQTMFRKSNARSIDWLPFRGTKMKTRRVTLLFLNMVLYVTLVTGGGCDKRR